MPQLTTIQAYEALLAPGEALTPAEQKLIAACRAGEPCQLSPTRPETPTPKTQIRAALLRLLITGGSSTCGLPETGVWLHGAYITDTLDLDFATARGMTTLNACTFAEQPQMMQATLRHLNLDDSHLPGLYAQGMMVTGSVLLRHLTATKTVDISGAQITGQLACEGANLNGQTGPETWGKALNAQGATVGDSVFLRKVIATGPIDMVGAQITGQLACDGANLNGQIGPETWGDALNAQGVTMGASLFLITVTATGTVDVNGAQITGQFVCVGASFDGKGKVALNAQTMLVTQGFVWREVKQTKGLVNLATAAVGELVDDLTSWPDDLNLDGFTYDRISAAPTDATSRLAWLRKGTILQGTFCPQPYAQLAKVLSEMGHDRDARTIRMAAKQDAAAHDRAVDRSERRVARAFRRFSATGKSSHFTLLTDLIPKLPKDRQVAASETLKRFRLFHNPPTRPDDPHPLPQTTLHFAQQQFRNDMSLAAVRSRLAIARSWVADIFMRRVVGYGYAPSRAFASLAVLWLAATFSASQVWTEGSFAPNSDVILVSSGWSVVRSKECLGILPSAISVCDNNPAKTWSSIPMVGVDWDTFSAAAYGLDLVVPVLDLGQTSAWAPSKDRGPWGRGLWWGRWVLEVFGWVVTALGAAAITGIIQRDRG